MTCLERSRINPNRNAGRIRPERSSFFDLQPWFQTSFHVQTENQRPESINTAKHLGHKTLKAKLRCGPERPRLFGLSSAQPAFGQLPDSTWVAPAHALSLTGQLPGGKRNA